MTTLALGIDTNEDLAGQRDGDLPAAEKVTRAFREFHKPVYWYLHGILANSSIAEDLTQETFLRLLGEFDRGVRIENQRAWLFRVATNLALSHKKNGSMSMSLMDVADHACRAAGPGPEETLLHDETSRLLSAGMNRLSAQERQCLLLRCEGLRYREIADALNIRVPTVATFLARAVRKLSESIHV